MNFDNFVLLVDHKKVIHEDYLINDCGDIYSLKSNKFLKPSTRSRNNNYLCVAVSKNNIKTTVYVHQAVKYSFDSFPSFGLEIDHVDGNKANNNLTNLEFVTRQENMRRYYERKRDQGDRIRIA